MLTLFSHKWSRATAACATAWAGSATVCMLRSCSYDRPRGDGRVLGTAECFRGSGARRAPGAWEVAWRFIAIKRIPSAVASDRARGPDTRDARASRFQSRFCNVLLAAAWRFIVRPNATVNKEEQLCRKMHLYILLKTLCFISHHCRDGYGRVKHGGCLNVSGLFEYHAHARYSTLKTIGRIFESAAPAFRSNNVEFDSPAYQRLPRACWISYCSSTAHGSCDTYTGARQQYAAGATGAFPANRSASKGARPPPRTCPVPFVV